MTTYLTARLPYSAQGADPAPRPYYGYPGTTSLPHPTAQIPPHLDTTRGAAYVDHAYTTAQQMNHTADLGSHAVHEGVQASMDPNTSALTPPHRPDEVDQPYHQHPHHHSPSATTSQTMHHNNLYSNFSNDRSNRDIPPSNGYTSGYCPRWPPAETSSTPTDVSSTTLAHTATSANQLNATAIYSSQRSTLNHSTNAGEHGSAISMIPYSNQSISNDSQGGDALVYSPTDGSYYYTTSDGSWQQPAAVQSPQDEYQGANHGNNYSIPYQGTNGGSYSSSTSDSMLSHGSYETPNHHSGQQQTYYIPNQDSSAPSGRSNGSYGASYFPGYPVATQHSQQQPQQQHQAYDLTLDTNGMSYVAYDTSSDSQSSHSHSHRSFIPAAPASNRIPPEHSRYIHPEPHNIPVAHPSASPNFRTAARSGMQRAQSPSHSNRQGHVQTGPQIIFEPPITPSPSPTATSTVMSPFQPRIFVRGDEGGGPGEAKKPTLACFFCRGRKIACGPSDKDRDSDLTSYEGRTCNQCARRQLLCVWPTESRRGLRKGQPARPIGAAAILAASRDGGTVVKRKKGVGPSASGVMKTGTSPI